MGKGSGFSHSILVAAIGAALVSGCTVDSDDSAIQSETVSTAPKPSPTASTRPAWAVLLNGGQPTTEPAGRTDWAALLSGAQPTVTAVAPPPPATEPAPVISKSQLPIPAPVTQPSVAIAPVQLPSPAQTPVVPPAPATQPTPTIAVVQPSPATQPSPSIPQFDMPPTVQASAVQPAPPVRHVVQPPAATPPPPAAQSASALPPGTPRYIDLAMYKIVVPYGAVSACDDFWKYISQDAVDADTAERLDRNGVRVGTGSIDDWPRFRTILDVAGAQNLPSHYFASSATDQEIAAGGDMPQQTLFVYDKHGLSGRVYDDCQDIWALSFGPSPAVGGDVRVGLCPLVRTTRRHYEYTVLNGQTSVDYASDEQVYDLGLSVDLAQGRFVVVAPSTQSSRSVSIGHQFLTSDGKSQRRETVFIFVASAPPRVRAVAATQP